MEGYKKYESKYVLIYVFMYGLNVSELLFFAILIDYEHENFTIEIIGRNIQAPVHEKKYVFATYGTPPKLYLRFGPPQHNKSLTCSGRRTKPGLAATTPSRPSSTHFSLEVYSWPSLMAQEGTGRLCPEHCEHDGQNTRDL